MKVNRIRPSLSITLDAETKSLIDAEADRNGLHRVQMFEALLSPGIQQVKSGQYDVVWKEGRFALQRRVQG